MPSGRATLSAHSISTPKTPMPLNESVNSYLKQQKKKKKKKVALVLGPPRRPFNWQTENDIGKQSRV